MALHRNARLGLAGRRALVADLESGCSCREAARRRGVSPTTACKWWSRWREATAEQRRSLRCLEDRSSRSEEHTSELQSHHDLVCRLLLEKKKMIASVDAAGEISPLARWSGTSTRILRFA